MKLINNYYFENNYFFVGASLNNFIYSYILYNTHNFKYKKCEDLNCYICKFSSNNNAVYLDDKFFVPIFNDSNCISIKLFIL